MSWIAHKAKDHEELMRIVAAVRKEFGNGSVSFNEPERNNPVWFHMNPDNIAAKHDYNIMHVNVADNGFPVVSNSQEFSRGVGFNICRCGKSSAAKMIKILKL